MLTQLVTGIMAAILLAVCKRSFGVAIFLGGMLTGLALADIMSASEHYRSATGTVVRAEEPTQGRLAH